MGALEDTVTQMTELEWLALGCSACCRTNAPTRMLLWHKMHVTSVRQTMGGTAPTSHTVSVISPFQLVFEKAVCYVKAALVSAAGRQLLGDAAGWIMEVLWRRHYPTLFVIFLIRLWNVRLWGQGCGEVGESTPSARTLQHWHTGLHWAWKELHWSR